MINIWFAPHYELIWRNIEIFLSWSMYGRDSPIQITSGSNNCAGLIFIISLRERLILFAWLLLRPFQRLYLFKFTFWDFILNLLLIIFQKSLLLFIKLRKFLSQPKVNKWIKPTEFLLILALDADGTCHSQIPSKFWLHSASRRSSDIFIQFLF